MKIDWVRKFTSRKFWLALGALAGAVLTAFKVPDLTIEQVTVIIGCLGTTIAYIFAESWIDKEGAKSEIEEKSSE